MSDSISRVRKQVYELTAQDFLDHPIWEFCSDEDDVEGQDEATVRPTHKSELTDELPGSCVVAAKVKFADGSLGAGYLYNCDEKDIGCVQPNVLMGTSQVNFWLGWLRFVPNATERVQLGYRTIGKAKEALFPVSFESAVNVSGRAMRVVMHGFMALGLDRKTAIIE